MVHYIRFLKTARVTNRTSQSVSVTALITITTDLGDSFLPSDAKLASCLVPADTPGIVLCKHEVHWQRGSRELSIMLTADLGHNTPLLRVHVFHGTASGSLPPTLDAWSAPFKPFADSRAAALVERQLSICCLPPVKVWEETDNSIAKHLWDAALACLLCFQDLVRARTPLPSLTKALQSNDSKQIRILELGAGCGMVGIALAQSFGNCAVQLTDQANAQDILFRNMEQAKPAKNSSLQHRILDWDVDSGEASLERDLSLIVISDCTYNADSCPDLVRTVARASSSSPGVRILVAMKRRHDSEEIFFELMRDAHMQILEHTTIELPSESSSVMEATPSEIELYVYCLMGSGESTSCGL